MKMQNDDPFAGAAVNDCITFDSDQGILSGVIAELRRDLTNGEPFFLVHLDHEWVGMFQAVPVSAVVSNSGPTKNIAEAAL